MDFLNKLENYKEDLIKTVQESIKIKSVEEEPVGNMPFGVGPYKALENILKVGEAMGFETKNLDGYAGYIEFGQGEETLGILGHVDVVPEGTGWTYPPYGAEIHDDKIYGRGTLDDKGPTIAALYAMKLLKDENVKLNKKVRMIIGANEETDWKCMDYYFKHEKAPELGFTPDATFPVIYAEKGTMSVNLLKKIKDESLLDIYGGTAANVVPEYTTVILKTKDTKALAEKINLVKEDYDIEVSEENGSVKIMTKGVTSHGSRPQSGISALHIMMKILGKVDLEAGNFKDFVDFYNERLGFYHNGENIGCALEDDVVGKITFNPGVIKLEEGKISLKIDIRYPVKSSLEEVEEKLRANLKDTSIELVVNAGDLKPLYVEKDSFLVKKLMGVYTEVTGEEVEPTTIGGATYARSMKNAVAFGPMFPGMKDLAHQKDEHISIEHLMQLFEIYTRAIYELTK